MKRVAFLLLSICIFLSMCACGKPADPWQEQYDLGVRYLSEGNYEEAIIAFTAAIEIEPKRAEAYISAADAYLNIGDFDQAEKILGEGYDATGDEKIAELLEKYKDGNYHSSDGRIFRTSGYDENGVLTWYHTHTYDIEGREASVTSFDADGNQTGHVNMTYDVEGRRTTFYAHRGGEVFAIERVYDAQGNVIQEKDYGPDGTLYRKDITYDNLGREKTSYRYEGEELVSFSEYEYFGDEKRWSHYDADGTLTGYDVFTEDRQEYYSATGVLECYTIHIRDESGNILGYEDYDGKGDLLSSTVVERD